jgi:hypothetical protein
MSKRLAPQDRPLYASEVRIVSVDFSGLLDDGETLASVTSVTDPSGLLSITDEQVNTTALNINGQPTAIGHACLFRVDHNGADAGTYILDIECLTSASQEVTGSVNVRVY